MKVVANTVRPGNVIEHDGRRYAVINYDLIIPGKGTAHIALEMRDVMTGAKTNQRFRTQDTIERLMTEERNATYIFAEGDHYQFMDSETYDQFVIDKSMIGADVDFLVEGMAVTINSVEGSPIGVNIPKQVTLTVEEAEPVVKGQTASSSFKPAIMDNGVKVMVPPHIAVGTRIVVSTAERTYVERAKD